MKKKQNLKRIISVMLCLLFAFSYMTSFAADEYAEERAVKVLSDKEAVLTDKEALDLGFILCVSRDLNLPLSGENGSQITWKSSHPKIIGDDGKYTVPEVITEVTLTATLKKGTALDTKKFLLTVNDRSMYEIVKDYADTMIKYGRDTKEFTKEQHLAGIKNTPTGGPTDNNMFNAAGRSLTPRGKSGLFFSMLDRETLQFPGYYVTDWPRVGYNSDERSSGCNTGQEYWLYNILYELSLLTGDENYKKIADDNLFFFITYCQHPTAGTLAWGHHTIYDPITGTVNSTNQYATSAKEQATWAGYTEPAAGDKQAMRTPFFINKFYELNPRAADNHMMSWWVSTVADQKTFAFGRHTDWAGSGNALGGYLSMLNPMAYAYAWGYHYSGNNEYLRALDSMMDMIERVCGMNENYVFTQDMYYHNNRSRQAWTGHTIRGANALMDIMPLVPLETQERMQKFIDVVFNDFIGYDPDRGFVAYSLLRTGQPTMYQNLATMPSYITIWQNAEEGSELKERVGGWILDWAYKNEFYKIEDKLQLVDYFPRTIAEEMQMHRMLYEETGDERFLDRALEYADFAIYDFWEMESLLPSMTHAQKKYYESSWGSVQVVDEIWQAYFLDIQRKTGVNPKEEAWEKAGYAPKTMGELLTDTEFMNKTRSSIVGGTANE
ncbi:MAG: hypothetical protein IKB93_05910 [Clostridia bacterium]|nr:hypothetical protein [Clostridia bacterium]